MTDIAPSAEGGADAATAAAAAAAAGGGGATPEWLGGLPDNLKADASLSRFADVPALASSYVDLRKTMGNRIAVPAADAPAEQWDPVFKALGRPDEPSAYEVPLPEGMDPATAEPFKQLAHKIGLTPGQVKALGEFDMQRMSDAESGFYAEGEQSLAEVKTELGDGYAQAEADAKAAFAKLFGADAATADALDRLVGSGPLVKAFANAAKLIGETGRIDGDGDGGMGTSDATAEADLKALNKDAAWREKLNNGDAATVAQHKNLLAAAQRHALSGGQ